MVEPTLALLQEMQERVLAHPGLHEEWGAAWKDFHGGRPDPAAANRFAEWFLLERDSQALGSPPVVAWAPGGVKEDANWTRLLDSLLGIFRAVPGPEGEPLQLEDLWSGRTIAVIGLERREVSDSSILAVGRFVQADEFHHRPLPGLLLLSVEGL